MGKRKEIIDSEEEEAIATASDAVSEERPVKSTTKPKTRISTKKPTIPSDDDDDEEELERPIKRKKAEKPATSSKKPTKGVDAAEAGSLLTDTSGDKYIDLGKKRRATIRAFKGTVYLDIREFYDASGEEKPGKKGISLSAEQWAVLKDNTDVIDRLFRKAKK